MYKYVAVPHRVEIAVFKRCWFQKGVGISISVSADTITKVFGIGIEIKNVVSPSTSTPNGHIMYHSPHCRAHD